MNHEAQLIAARRLQKAGDLARAEEIVRAVLAEAPDLPEGLSQLATLQYDRLAFADSEATLVRLSEVAPARMDPEAYQRLIKIRTTAGRDEDARAAAVLALSAHPDNVTLISAFAGFHPPEAARTVLEDAVARLPQTQDKAALLKHITSLRALINRRAAGLPESAAVSWDDASQWRDPEGLARLAAVIEPALTGAAPTVSIILDAALIAIARRQWDQAESLLRMVRERVPGSFADFTAFGRAFHDSLALPDSAAMVAGLAPVETVREPPPGEGPMLFMASDVKYFWKFALPFLRQLEAATPLDVRLHILDGPAAAWRDIAAELGTLKNVRVAMAAEDSQAMAQGFSYARIYYVAVRYLRFLREVERQRRPIWLIDADVQLRRDPWTALASLADYDVALRPLPLSLDPINKVAGGWVGVSPTPRGLAFLRRVAAYILHWKNAGTWRWSVDQAALFSTFAYMAEIGEAPHAHFLGTDTFNLRGETGGVFLFPAGISKFSPSVADSGAP